MTVHMPRRHTILSPLLPLHLPLHPDFHSFRPIIRRSNFLEPRVLESLFGGDAVCGVVNKDLAEEIEEEAAEGVVRRDDVLF
jgi:hypothetical protein